MDCALWGPSQLTHLGEVCGQRRPLSEHEVVGQVWSRVEWGLVHQRQRGLLVQRRV